MDTGTRLALRAIILGLRRSGQIGQHGLAVMVDELRMAATEARRALYDHEAEQIELLLQEVYEGPGPGLLDGLAPWPQPMPPSKITR